MTFFRQRSVRFWTGAMFVAGAAVTALAAAAIGGPSLSRGLASAAFMAALGLRFASYELEDPGFSRGRVLLLGAILAAILGLGVTLPDRVAVSAYAIGAVLVAFGAAGDLWGLWRRRRVAG